MTLDWIGDVLLPRLLAAGLQSLLVVAAVWLLCRYLRLSAALRCWLWWCAALQLLLGALWPTPLSLPLLPASWDRASQAANVAAAPQLSSSAQLPFFVTKSATDATVAAATAPTAHYLTPDWLSWPLVFAALWLSGFLLVAFASVRGYAAACRRIAASRPCEQPQVLSTYRALGASLGLNRLPPLRVSTQIDSPQLIGPPATVLLPRERLAHLSGDELAMALHHELVHVRRRDLWWGWVPALVQHLFFFHPLAHVIAREYSIARETACDAAVLDSRRYAAHDYGRLLLRLGVAPRPAAGVASASPTYTILKRRLIMLQNATSSSHLGGLILTAAIVLVGLVPYRVTAAAGERAPQSQSRSVSIHSSDKNGETRITEINNGGDPQVWAIKGDQYYKVSADGGYQPVTDAATRARLRQRMDESRRAAVDAEKAGRAAEQAGREAERAGREAERHAQAAGVAAERAARDAERAGRDAERQAQAASVAAQRAARDAGQQARLDGEQARRDADQAKRDGEQARRDAAQARRDVEQAQRDAEQARRDASQHGLDSAQHRRDIEQARRDAAQARRDALLSAPEAAQIRRIAEQARRDAGRHAMSKAEIARISEQARRDASRYAMSPAEIARITEQAKRDASRYAMSPAEIARITEQAKRDASRYAMSSDEIARITEQAKRDASRYAMSPAEIARITEQAKRDASRYAMSSDEIARITEQAKRDASRYAMSPAEIARITEQAKREAQVEVWR
ncbi:M56 family metallopeptidase [Lysobacter capsici]|uniref:M56 family metallopeptidase n=2 Tax=Lysobacter capsici TaxID=435897 RepID=UPI00287B8A6F|nr:M56 family metallopeptidase [Lysobacter capsici]WND82339.1 M56 family metallopeptidase [Lysobacter capsici]WND87535.1 M56 family metallopeptidase [Lysobacter capsici]